MFERTYGSMPELRGGLTPERSLIDTALIERELGWVSEGVPPATRV